MKLEDSMKPMTRRTLGMLAVTAGGMTFAATSIATPATDAVDQGEVFNIAIFKVKSGQEPAFEKIMKQVVINSRAESGNLEYRFQQSLDDPHVYAAYEVFRTEADAKAHLNSEQIQKALPSVLAMLDGPIDAKSYKIVK
jgi:quinol monooxygenase YgiN